MLLRMLTGTQRPLWGTLVVVLVFLVMALLSPLSQAASSCFVPIPQYALFHELQYYCYSNRSDLCKH
jgi:hypothetical protein